MKVVYQVCCGVDVHKRFLIGTIISTTKGVQPHYQKKRFSTFNSDLNRFADWLIENNCFDVCMESTGKYWVPVFNILEKHGIRTVIANPKWVKAVKGNKDDTKGKRRFYICVLVQRKITVWVAKKPDKIGLFRGRHLFCLHIMAQMERFELSRRLPTLRP